MRTYNGDKFSDLPERQQELVFQMNRRRFQRYQIEWMLELDNKAGDMRHLTARRRGAIRRLLAKLFYYRIIFSYTWYGVERFVDINFDSISDIPDTVEEVEGIEVMDIKTGIIECRPYKWKPRSDWMESTLNLIADQWRERKLTVFNTFGVAM